MKNDIIIRFCKKNCHEIKEFWFDSENNLNFQKMIVTIAESIEDFENDILDVEFPNFEEKVYFFSDILTLSNNNNKIFESALKNHLYNLIEYCENIDKACRIFLEFMIME